VSDEAPINPVPPSPSGSQRTASVTLRSEEAQVENAMQLDAANQSLADALRLVFTGIRFAMVGLLLYFVFSGFQMIKETESGIRLLFGRVTGDNLPSGPRFSWPYPMGEMLRVDTGAITLELEDSFMPQLTADQKKLPIAQVAQQGVKLTLKPGEDGSLITGDSNIAHTKWKILYLRQRPRDFVEHILPEDEKSIVRAAVEQGVVQAVSTIGIDDLLKQSSGDLGSVATRAREIAQRTLDTLKSGIEIRQLTLQEKFQPLTVFAEFSGVQEASQRASEHRSTAETRAKGILNEMAGEAYPLVIAQIDLYEGAVEKKDVAEQERILATINALLEGKPVKIGETEYARKASGRITSVLNEANQYRTTIVSQRRAELSSFESKLKQFKSNPDVVIQRDWADAMAVLLARPTVEIFALPRGTDTVTLNINRDQEFTKAMQQIDTLRKAKMIEQLRQEAADKARNSTNTDVLELQATPKAGNR